MDEIEQFKQRIEDYMRDTEAKFQKGDERFAELCRRLDANDLHINEINTRIAEICSVQSMNTSSLEKIKEDTGDLVEWVRDVRGAARLGVNIQRLGLWLMKWPVIGVGIYHVIVWTNEFIEKVPKK